LEESPVVVFEKLGGLEKGSVSPAEETKSSALVADPEGVAKSLRRCEAAMAFGRYLPQH
jgi:hypothetical protein